MRRLRVRSPSAPLQTSEVFETSEVFSAFTPSTTQEPAMFWRRLTPLALTFLLALSWATRADEAAVEARMRADLMFLASDECEGRGVGTKGLDLAASYIAKSFEKSG